MFIYVSSRQSLLEFELIKGLIRHNDGKGNVYIQQLLNELKNKLAIDELSKKYPNYFLDQNLDWEVRYEIAMKSLEHELINQSGRYTFDVIQYLFAYLMLPQEFRYLFFFMRGFPIEEGVFESVDMDKIWSCSYEIFNLDEDIYESYLLDRGNAELIFKLKDGCKLFNVNNEDDLIYVLQVTKTY